MSIKLLTERHLEFLRLTGGWSGSSESIHVKIPHCCKLNVTAKVAFIFSVGVKKDFCHVLIEKRKNLRRIIQKENRKDLQPITKHDKGGKRIETENRVCILK